jgi:hypothetical protein
MWSETAHLAAQALMKVSDRRTGRAAFAAISRRRAGLKYTL